MRELTLEQRFPHEMLGTLVDEIAMRRDDDGDEQ